MAYQKVFKRYEIKYLISTEQMQRILAVMEAYMTQDRFGHSTIRNIYFDTDDYILARHSIAKPDFKEKLRIRSYSRIDGDGEAFVELKRKFDKVVYKRRVELPEHLAMDWTCRRRQLTNLQRETGRSLSAAASVMPVSALAAPATATLTPAVGTSVLQADMSIPANPAAASLQSSQLGSEIEYFLDYYKDLRPAVFLSYDREAFKMKDGSDFRVTFDTNILARDYDLSLTSDVYGTPVLEEGKVLMELKCSGGIPLWMTEVLSQERIYKTSFSKYGTAYTRMILPQMLHGLSAAAAKAPASAAAASKAPASTPDVAAAAASYSRSTGGRSQLAGAVPRHPLSSVRHSA